MPEELLQLVDPDGIPAGTALRSACHGNPALIQAVVHLYLFDSQGRLYLQKRSKIKDTYPGRWDTSVGGHMAPGEKPEEALAREAREELGLEVRDASPLSRYLYRDEWESEYVHAYRTGSMGEPLPNPEEIEEGRFFSPAEIRERLRGDPQAFTPHFRRAFEELERSRLIVSS